MLEPVVAFFQRIAYLIGRPFVAAGRWFSARRWVVKGPIAVIALAIVIGYGYFIVQTQSWTNFNPDYVDAYRLSEQTVDAGTTLPATAAPAPSTSSAETGTTTAAPAQPAAQTCQRSAIVNVTAGLIDFNVDENAWVSSMLLYKLGLFGIDWDHTPFLDNKASFQRGVNQAIRRTTVELVDSLGRMRGTSGINTNLQAARGNMQFDEESWYFGLNPFGPKTPSPSYYRAAARDLRLFDNTLASCAAIFDARADNLVEFIDRITSDIGDTSSILRERSELHSAGWFDTRADDRFWFAYGQLYGYYGILSAARADFQTVIQQRNIGPLYTETLKQLRAALRIQPLIISNGAEDGWIMPNHLSTMGFYILRARSNLVEMRDVLAR
ncbi:hypothetical protein SAMN05880582_1011341 [Rhizobium sp. RU20A]|uniref:DUF2333 family protein n=1 Tax=Rhizobium sp. RU20A TaxID=1907412 RepID=UPI0009560D2B|nr:DUF2333 family protein [Rhizobium sp. RU20A]SIQ27686.1 hypothetical protein SAMN05880582_1011341 [Rhizobium sp. RU20A]